MPDSRDHKSGWDWGTLINIALMAGLGYFGKMVLTDSQKIVSNEQNLKAMKEWQDSLVEKTKDRFTRKDAEKMFGGLKGDLERDTDRLLDWVVDLRERVSRIEAVSGR